MAAKGLRPRCARAVLWYGEFIGTCDGVGVQLELGATPAEDYMRTPSELSELPCPVRKLCGSDTVMQGGERKRQEQGKL